MFTCLYELTKLITFIFWTVYSLVQFVDDGILAICTSKNIRKRDDGRKEAQYGDEYYLCTVMFESGES